MPDSPQPGQVIVSNLFHEPMRVITAETARAGTWALGLVGTTTERFRSVILTEGQLEDITAKNLGYDVTSLDPRSGEMRLIEVKGLAAATGTILLTPNERRVAEDRRDCYWLYIVTNCNAEPVLQEPVHDPARFPWHEVTKVQHYRLSIDAMTRPLKVSENLPPYGGEAG